MTPPNAGSVSAVPSGSAGEPTPTTANIKVPAAQYKSASEADSAASRLAALRQHPEVRCAWERYQRERHLWGVKAMGSYTDLCAALDALLSAVAAAATAQTDADYRAHIAENAAWLRALAGGAPPATQTTDTTEE